MFPLMLGLSLFLKCNQLLSCIEGERGRKGSSAQKQVPKYLSPLFWDVRLCKFIAIISKDAALIGGQRGEANSLWFKWKDDQIHSRRRALLQLHCSVGLIKNMCLRNWRGVTYLNRQAFPYEGFVSHCSVLLPSLYFLRLGHKKKKKVPKMY